MTGTERGPCYVYIAGPYRGDGSRDAVKNIRDAIDAWHRLREKGHYPYCPHAQTALMDLRRDLDPPEFLAYDQAWLEKCDVVLRLDGASEGADAEVERAEELGIPVVHDVEKFAEVPP